MRKLILTAVIGLGLLLAGADSYAQEGHHYVQHHPYATVGKRPARPTPRHVWVGSEWEWKDNRYVETPGHWEVPPHAHATWHAGHWSATKKGSYWVAGRWS